MPTVVFNRVVRLAHPQCPQLFDVFIRICTLDESELSGKLGYEVLLRSGVLANWDMCQQRRAWVHRLEWGEPQPLLTGCVCFAALSIAAVSRVKASAKL